MSSFFTRQSAAFRNDLNRSLGALLGIAQGLLSDKHLSDLEIDFLREWLVQNEALAASWPGDIIASRVQHVLADGVVTDDERTHLVKTLQDLVRACTREGGGAAQARVGPGQPSGLPP